MEKKKKRDIPLPKNIDIEQLAVYRKEMEALMAYYQCDILEMETKFKVLDRQFSLDHERNPIEGIQSRLKSAESIIEKLQRKGLKVSAREIEKNLYDVAGIRVICSFIDDIYMLKESLERQDDITILEEKDYIKNPKKNGYRSLHLIVEIPIFLLNEKKMMKVEVQLRTIAMEFWANLEHKLRYKKNLDASLLSKVGKDLSTCADVSAKLDLKMQNIRDMIESIENK